MENRMPATAAARGAFNPAGMWWAGDTMLDPV
jgi:hypothetical protein